MQLIYGTTNKAKINFMKRRIEPLGIEMLSLDDAGAPKLDITESGNSPLENARIKALAYYRELKRPVFSCDSGLYIDGLDDARQPGAHVRGRGGDMDDEETIVYYAALAAGLGGRMTARYQNAICLVLDDERVFEHMEEDIASERFLLVSTPHEKRREGFPLDSLSVHIESGKYYFDLDGYGEKYSQSDEGFVAFFKEGLSEFFCRQ